MPELPEVEHFRQLLLPLVAKDSSGDDIDVQSLFLRVQCPSPTPPKTFPTNEDFQTINHHLCKVTDVLRKGKLLCIVINNMKTHQESYLYLHMGMTGRISTQDFIPKLESIHANDSFPPPHTHLKLLSNNHEVAFSDPRRFGKVLLKHTPLNLDEEWNDLAPDALDPSVNFDRLIGQKRGIKTILLDQKAVLCGIGNWVADEVLYQSSLHPDQNFCTNLEIAVLKEKILDVLSVANECLKAKKDFPSSWIFHLRWSKAISKNQAMKDFKKRPLIFIQSGGRSTAIVPSIQKLIRRSAQTQPSSEDTHKDNTKSNTNKAITRKKKQKTTKETGQRKLQSTKQHKNKRSLVSRSKIKNMHSDLPKKKSQDVTTKLRRSQRLRTKSL